MRRKITICAAAIATVAFAPASIAAIVASATTDLNIRSGPGPQYEIIGLIQSNDEAVIEGCIQGSLWCQVTHGGRKGWAYSGYLTTEFSGSRVVLAERRADIGVPVVTYETTGSAAVGAAGGAVTGALVAGPVGAAVGGVAGATAGTVIDPPAEVRTYITTQPVDPVYLEGEVVLGAQLPPPVQLHPVPNYQYQYVYVNRQPMLVEPASRRIVYVYR